MATTPFVFQATTGLTLSVKFEAGAGATGTPAASYAATEKTTAKGWYTISITEALVGRFYWHAEDGGAAIISNGLSMLADTTDTHFGFEPQGSTGYSVFNTLTSKHVDANSFGALFVDMNTEVELGKDQATIAANNTQS